MSPPPDRPRAWPGRAWIAAGALWMAVAVALGAFGAHALAGRLAEAGRTAEWETAVRYQAWHALATILVGLLQGAGRPAPMAGWCFLGGSVLFSGSLYGLCLGGPGSFLGPVTPLGGTLLLVGWAALAWRALRPPGGRGDGPNDASE